jgi:predicted amidohydrolase
MRCKVAAAQLQLKKGSYSERIETAQNLIRQAAQSGAEIVCLPEHWLLEYWREAAHAADRIAETARTERIFVITGANYTETDSGTRIRSMLIGPGGGRIGWQDKIHLFGDERTVAVPGETYQILETPFGKVGITICYDNAFPEAARTLAVHGAELLFVPSRIISDGLDPWLLYLKTRALENRLPVIAPNVFDPPRYPGGSVIIELEEPNPNGVVLPRVTASPAGGSSVILADINLDKTRRLRSKRLSERRQEAYRIQRPVGKAYG